MAAVNRKALFDVFKPEDGTDATTMQGSNLAAPSPAPSATPSLGGGGDFIQAKSLFDTSGMSDAQRQQMAGDTAAQRSKDAAGTAADQAFLASNGGQWGDRQQYRPGVDPSAGAYGGTLVGGTDFTGGTAQAPKIGGLEPGGYTGGSDVLGNAQPTDGSAAPTWAPGANAGKNSGMILGFDTSKLNDPSSGSAAGSKYTPAVKAFSAGLKQDVGVSRGGLDNMVNYLQANGFKDAKAVGDDKIDFGDGQGPIDVIRSDGQIVFQNTTGNPTWEGQHGGGGSGGASAAAAPGGIPLPSQLQGDPMAQIQAALAKYSSSPNLQSLLAQLGGG